MLVVARYLFDVPAPHAGHVHGLILGPRKRFTLDPLGQYAKTVQEDARGQSTATWACLTVIDDDESEDATMKFLVDIVPFLDAVRTGHGYVGPLVDGLPL